MLQEQNTVFDIDNEITRLIEFYTIRRRAFRNDALYRFPLLEILWWHEFGHRRLRCRL